jgi:hypothetical protein
VRIIANNDYKKKVEEQVKEMRGRNKNDLNRILAKFVDFRQSLEDEYPSHLGDTCDTLLRAAITLCAESEVDLKLLGLRIGFVKGTT